ncbi:aKG-HExxH-type peptide beta-hydroxylase [Vibrio parahaemolyticus]|uniref:aKG-HExxH-type peptide beta-hydroxylase n=1 Tax=Vibrio parahaemolyticus TaxID=670 RepID=UPI0011EDAD9C|nr:HEXXH motif-containing putative peptide modification protein [Vibrio parahaemolyticus]KAB5596799.1 hypothetical protein F0578_24695 [Vibrio parahaemolyticus]
MNNIGFGKKRSLLVPSNHGIKGHIYPFHRKILHDYAMRFCKNYYESNLVDTISNSTNPWSTPKISWEIATNSSPSNEESKNIIYECIFLPKPRLKIYKNSYNFQTINWVKSYLKNEAKIANKKDIVLEIIQKNIDEYSQVIRDSLDLIHITWPELYLEMTELLREVVFFKGDWLRSCSLTATFGAVYICPRNNWNTIDYADILIHEAAHHYLESVTHITPIIKNPNLLVNHPIRDDARTLEKSIHASFVLSRLVMFHHILDDTLVGPSLNYSNNLLNHYSKMLNNSLDTLRSSASFTDSGFNLYKEMLTLSQSGP